MYALTMVKHQLHTSTACNLPYISSTPVAIRNWLMAQAAWAGLFAILLKFFAAAWKFLLLALVPIGAWIKKLFTGRPKTEELATVPVEPEQRSEDTPV